MAAPDVWEEGWREHVANALQPLTLIASAPEMFQAADVTAAIDGAVARLARARAILTGGTA